MLVIVFGSIATTMIITGLASYAIFESRVSNKKQARDLSFHVAEAGINYYRWHLAHDPNDYQDGGNSSGPYVHEYVDKDGTVIGYFSLDIDPPLSGATIVTVRSTGWTLWEPNATRTIQARFGFPSLTDYAFVENTDMAFSQTTVVHGKVHANGGIKFDGTADATIESAKETYTYSGQTKPGVWGVGGPTGFWEFPVPNKDFGAISADLGALRDLADAGGIHLNSSGKEGYYLHFIGTQFQLYKVKSRSCYYGDPYYSRGYWYWGVVCYDKNSTQSLGTYTIPANGAIFVEDTVWVDGVVDGRVTIGAGRFPVSESTYRDIIVTGNLTYNAVGSDDVVGLIAQRDVVVPYSVPNDMEIDAAALAQYGKIRRPYYAEFYGGAVRNSLLFFGSQISFSGGGWKYITQSNQVISGFVNTNHTYDGNLRYLPPPSFPVESTYELISWEEIET